MADLFADDMPPAPPPEEPGADAPLADMPGDRADGLAVVAVYFRPQSAAAWQLPGTGWLLLTIGLGATLGLVGYFLFKRPQEGPEFVVLTLGVIGFGAGIAGYLHLSPVVVCFLAGTCVAQLPVEHRARIRAALRRLERPIYFLALIVIGALWRVDDWRGWVLVPVFTGARFLGKWLGMRGGAHFAGLRMSAEERQVLAVLAPQAAEEAAHILAGGVEHQRACGSGVLGR